MKKIKNIKIVSIISVFFLVLSLFSGIKIEGVFAAETTPYITIHSINHEKTDSNKNLCFNADATTNLVTITINAYNIGSGDITVKYYAEDATAVCEAGDYTIQNSSITSTSTTADKKAATHELSTIVLNSTKTTATVVYELKPQAIATKISSFTIDNENYHYFNFRIADITGGSIKDNQKTYKCIANNKIEIDCDSDSNGYYMRPYAATWEKKASFSAWDGPKNDQTIRFNLLFDTKTSTGLSVSRKDVVAQLLDTKLANIYTHMYIYGDAHISNWDELTFKTYADDSGATDAQDEYLAYWYEKWVYEDGHDCEIKTKNKYDKYAIIKPEWGDKVRVIGHNGCNTYDRWADLTYTSKLSDDTMPVLSGSYVDASSLLVDGTIRLIIRFTEPVQAKTPTNLAIIGKVNSKKDIKFEYETGNCTDTLCFKTNIKDCGLDNYDNQITKVNISEIENFNTICDFGHSVKTGKNNFLDNYDFNKVLGDHDDAPCDIDLRVPTITSVASTNPTDTTKSRSVDIKMGCISKATLYYSWSTDKDQVFTSVKDYDSSIELTGDDTSSVKKTVSISNVTGEYYLHACIQNIYGKTATFLIGSGGVMSNKTGHGYCLDNTKPTLDDVSLYKESLTEKVFDIRVDDGDEYYDGGVETIYISIKKDKNSTTYNDQAIYSTNSIINKTIPDDIYIGDRADVYYMDANLKNVTYQSMSSPAYYGGSSPTSIMFSSKDKAYEYFYYSEMQDFQTIYLSSSNTAMLDTVKANRATGETHEPAIGDVWIKYKKINFKFSGTYKEADWVYYYYSGTNKDSIDISTALQNIELANAVDNVANLLTDEGKYVNLYDYPSMINADGVISIPYTQARASVSFTGTYYGASFAKSIDYKDSTMIVSKSGGHLTVKLNYDTGIIGCPVDDYVDLWIGFYVVDGAGNSNRDSIVYKSYRYDTRELFDATFQTNDAKAMDDVDGIMVYKTNSTFNFSYTIDESKGVVGDLKIDKIYAYVKEDDAVRELSNAEYSSYVTINSYSQGLYVNKISVQTKSVGYLKIEIVLDYSGSKKKHDPYEFYITNSFNDVTENYSKSLTNRIIVNNLYKLSEQYTYMSKDRVVTKESYGNTETGSVYFSTLDALTDYVRFMEYQDFQLVVLNGTMAESLMSGGIGTYTKADGETNIPSAGQTWIRYKIPGWTSESTETAWVYYFYNSSNVASIQTNKITGTILENALNTVVNSIVSKAVKVNLVNGSYIDDYGSPTLLEDEIHPNKIVVGHTKTNSLFSSDIQYSGDEKLFDSTFRISIDGEYQDVPVLTNLKLTKQSELTHIYYAYYNGQELSSLQYSELEYTSNQTYREALNGANGTYFIREVSMSGIKEYVIYLDNLAPSLNIKFTSPSSSVTTSRELNTESNGYQFGCKTFTISSISLAEFDTYSYVIVYDEYFKVEKILYAKDLVNSEYTLPNGSWTIVVSDRSGNSYSFGVSCTTSKLTLEVSIDDGNDYVKVVINREPDEIYRYQVFLNGADTPIDDIWNGSLTTVERYKESGFYYIYVQDIYGYILEEKGESGGGIVFERTAPSVIWSYLDLDYNSYSPYKESATDSPMSMYKSLGNVYYISTSRPIKLRMDEAYKYEITGLDMDSEVKYPTGKDIAFGNLEEFKNTNKLSDFSITLWYEDYPDIRTTYNVTCDTDSPDILLTYKTVSWQNTDELDAFELTDLVDIGYIYTPDDINYINCKEIINNITNNAVVNSNLITLNCEDISGVKQCYVYLQEPGKQEELFLDLTPTYGKIENISLSRYGKYRVVAYDVFNNINQIEFTNTQDERVQYKVDEELYNQRDKSTIYGNDNATIKLLQDGLLTIEVIEGENKFFYYIEVIDGVAYLQELRCSNVTDSDGYTYAVVYLQNKQIPVLTSSGTYVNQDVELFSYLDPAYTTANKFYKVLTKYGVGNQKQDPINLYISYDQNYLLTFKVACEDDDITVKFRVNYEYTFEPYLLTASLSHRVSSVDLYDTNNQKIEINSGKLSYTNSTFTFGTNIDPEITKIEISYSDVKEFTNFTTLYPYEKKSSTDTNVLGSFDTTINGFYCINIYNIYGNKNTFVINRSDEFLVVSIAQYEDGDQSKLSKNFEGIVKSNGTIVIEGYGDNVEFRVTKNSLTTSTSRGIKLDGYYQLTLSDEGSYTVKVIDKVYGNSVEVFAIIKHSKLYYDPLTITGYNDKALRVSEGYTNQILSIQKDKIIESKIKYIEIDYNNTKTVLFDSVNEEDELDESLLINSIGTLGDGIYYAIFKDEYGSKVTKEIHYSSTPTLEISRKITSSQENEPLEINEYNIENGFWSNDSFEIISTAEVYRFSVNGVTDECPKTLSFAGTGNGTIPYEIYYIDEYGFEYSLKATLDRKDITIELDEVIKTTVINDILNTSDPLSISFSDGVCYYTIDGENETEYKSGETLYTDGAYRFNCFDKSGNSASLVVIKDSTCEYKFTINGDSRSIIDGQALNADYVSLVSDDNVYITKYYIDGVKQDDLELQNFKKGGHYHFFLVDGVGNTSVFEFYLITHNLSSFSYQTPNTYIITEMWFSGKDGTLINYLSTGKVIAKDNRSVLEELKEDGDYQVVMTSSTYKNGLSFSFTIDTRAPQVSLKGYDGSKKKTIEDVELLGCSVGDTIYVYKDEVLINTVEVIYNSDSLKITEGGKYKIVVVNEAGNETVLTFEKIKILNDSGSALVIIGCLAAIAGLVIGVVLKNKQKYDE